MLPMGLGFEPSNVRYRGYAKVLQAIHSIFPWYLIFQFSNKGIINKVVIDKLFSIRLSQRNVFDKTFGPPYYASDIFTSMQPKHKGKVLMDALIK